MTDYPTEGATGDLKLLPMEIALNSLLSAREKLDLLHRMRADLTTEHAHPEDIGFDLEAIDKALDSVRQGVETGDGTEAAGPSA
jgi:hypothetical protein